MPCISKHDEAEGKMLNLPAWQLQDVITNACVMSSVLLARIKHEQIHLLNTRQHLG